jgi:hypothetical protein
MIYWRDDNFKGLKEIVEELQDKGVDEYRNYLLLREKGLRNRAFESLNKFLSDTIDWPFKRRKEFVNWLCNIEIKNPEVYDLIPTPLREGLINTTLDEWCSIEPENNVPWRWKGGYDNWKKALSLNPKDEMARTFLLKAIIHDIDYSLHELPYGYIGKPIEDLEFIKEAESLIPGLLNSELMQKYRETFTECKALINSYLEYRESGSQNSFEEWGLIEGKATKLT